MSDSFNPYGGIPKYGKDLFLPLDTIDATSPFRIKTISSFEAIGSSIGLTVKDKQDAYGNSFGKSGDVMRILYPDGIKPAQLDDALAVVRVIDKLFRIATKKDAFGESPWNDIAGYAILGVDRDSHAKQEIK
jgi:hypothetical protein